MSVSSLFARLVAVIGGTALQYRRLTEGARLGSQAPAGRRARAQVVFADKLDHPRWIEVLPNGDMLVAEATSADRPRRGPGLRHGRDAAARQGHRPERQPPSPRRRCSS